MKHLFLLGLLVSSVASATAPVRVDSISFNGSGCPTNKESVNFHWEETRLVVNFADMVPSKGAGISLVEARKNCTITLDAKAPEGFRYTVRTIRANGFAALAGGDSLVLTTTSYQQGSAETSTYSQTWKGSRQDFQERYAVPESDKVYSSCEADRALVYNTALRIANDDGNGDQQSYAALDSLSLTLELSRCPGR